MNIEERLRKQFANIEDTMSDDSQTILDLRIKVFDLEVERDILKERNAVLRRFWEESQKKVEELEEEFNLSEKMEMRRLREMSKRGGAVDWTIE